MTRPDRDQRVARLQAAAARKSQAAVTRAEAGIRRLLRAGEPVTFRAVARAGGVSIDFLYRHLELRGRIDHLRAQHTRTPRAAPSALAPGESGIVTILRARLKAGDDRERELRACIRDLEQQLAIAHGEILTLGRAQTCRRCEQTSSHARRSSQPVCHERGAGG